MINLFLHLVMMVNIQPPVRFLISFLLLFGLFYGLNLLFIGITAPGGWYSSILDQYFNYIRAWRQFCILSTTKILEFSGYTIQTTETTLKVKGHSGFRLVYSCLGYGVMSFFAAFTLSFPKPFRSRIFFLAAGLIVIQLLNTIRFVLISLFYDPITRFPVNHHDLFNCLLYASLLGMMYVWVNYRKKTAY